MKVFTCNSFKGHYPVGTAAVIQAKTEEEARHLLLKHLIEVEELPNNAEDILLEELPPGEYTVVILANGEY